MLQFTVFGIPVAVEFLTVFFLAGIYSVVFIWGYTVYVSEVSDEPWFPLTVRDILRRSAAVFTIVNLLWPISGIVHEAAHSLAAAAFGIPTAGFRLTGRQLATVFYAPIPTFHPLAETVIAASGTLITVSFVFLLWRLGRRLRNTELASPLKFCAGLFLFIESLNVLPLNGYDGLFVCHGLWRLFFSD